MAPSARPASRSGSAPPSKAGPAGAAVDEDPLAVAEDDLAVGADVDEQPQPLVAVHAGGQHAGDDVAADVGAERREDERPRPRVHVEAELGGEQRRHGARGIMNGATPSGSGSMPSASAVIVALPASAIS